MCLTAGIKTKVEQSIHMRMRWRDGDRDNVVSFFKQPIKFDRNEFKRHENEIVEKGNTFWKANVQLISKTFEL